LADSVLEVTASLCPACLKRVPAVVKTDGKIVYMEKTCEQHGAKRGAVWNSLEKYLWSFRFTKPGTPVASYLVRESRGCPYDCGLCPRHKQHTCLAILEVTEYCNLQCPVCLALAKRRRNGMDHPSLEQIGSAVDKLLATEGRRAPLQFSGGEPTIRPDLPEIISSVSRRGFRFLEVDTNGIELARNPDLARQYKDAGLMGIYLQFDGITDDIYQRTRGVPLVRIKERAITNAKKAGLMVTLAVTAIKGVNDHQLWDIVYYALKKRLNGVNFQPFAMLGRYPEGQGSSGCSDPMVRLTTPDVPRLLGEQSGGRILADDFVPVPCPDNRCQMLSYLRLDSRGATSINRLVDIEGLLDYYNKFTNVEEMGDAIKSIKEKIYEMWSASAAYGNSDRPSLAHVREEECLPCCNITTPEHDGRFFAIGIHGMMDVWNSDVHRHERCCVMELALDGRLIPFCLYNMTSTGGQRLYRQIKGSQTVPLPLILPAKGST
jgi:uncharacterized radical SAM superfamily Fe-S cluster-containing enzyme